MEPLGRPLTPPPPPKRESRRRGAQREGVAAQEPNASCTAEGREAPGRHLKPRARLRV